MLQKLLALVTLSLTITYTSFAKETIGDGPVLNILRDTPVESIEPMRDYLHKQKYESDFDGDVFIVHLQDGTKAVFKQLEGDATIDAFGELAAYRASQFLGFPKVPPVTLRNINGSNGTLHEYIQPSVDALAPGEYEKALNAAPEDDVANLNLFYFVFGQWDTGPHNIIIKKQNYDITLYAIDNAALVMNQHALYGDVPFVGLAYSESIKSDKNEANFPFHKVHVIQNPTFENVKKELSDYFPDSFLRRFTRDTKPVHYVLYKNRIWRQFYKGDPSHKPSYTTHYPEQSIKKLKALDIPTLKLIFQDALDNNAQFASREFFESILSRRDQVIRAYEKQQNSLKQITRANPKRMLNKDL